MPGVSAVVLTQNVSGIIERCLRSLSFADEIVVVDAESTDDTPDIARDLGARVVTNAWPGFAEQRRFGLDLASFEWVFMCDSDEEVSPELAVEVMEAVSGADERTPGFRVHRRNQFLGDWMDHGPWTQDFETRLVRRAAARVTEQSVHEGLQVEGTIETLKHPLYHYTHPTVRDSIARLNRYTTLESLDRVGRRRIRLIDPLIPPVGVFLRYYVTRGCWRAGVRGFLLSAITSMYKSVLYIKIYLLQHGKGR